MFPQRNDPRGQLPPPSDPDQTQQMPAQGHAIPPYGPWPGGHQPQQGASAASRTSRLDLGFWVGVLGLVALVMLGATAGVGGVLMSVALYLIGTALYQLVRGRSWLSPLFGADRRQAALGIPAGLALLVIGAVTGSQTGVATTGSAPPPRPVAAVTATTTPTATPTPTPTPPPVQTPEPATQETPATQAPQTTQPAPAPTTKVTTEAPRTQPPTTRAPQTSAPAPTLTGTVQPPKSDNTRTSQFTQPTTKPTSKVSTNKSTAGAFKNCTAAWAAGAAPVHRGDPGYGSHLDGDNDGVGCEKPPR